jgi:hypothetical protein
MSSRIQEIVTIFNKMKTKLPKEHRNSFALEIWDESGLLNVEKELGLKVEV